MPEPFGTHHSKMMILLRHDDCAQVIIHTANMIPQDWTNLCQGVWRSPLLPLVQGGFADAVQPSPPSPIGSGQRFKTDLLRYLGAYASRTRPLTDQLRRHDFSSVRAALIASTPCRQRAERQNAATHTSWGWPGLKEVLSVIPFKPPDNSEDAPNVVVQISSVATLTEKWLTSFFNTLSTVNEQPLSSSAHESKKPTTNIIFPTADEIRRSLDGYQSGVSIHMKLQSVAQKKQLALLQPMLCHWAGDSRDNHKSSATTAATAPPPQSSSSKQPTRHALRRRAAPHIKTYIRFRSQSATHIDWALLTSANLSTQAWGALPAKDGEVRVCSWEVGVLVWPALFSDAEAGEPKEDARMVPVFGRDGVGGAEVEGMVGTGRTLVACRMPYDLPLVRYGGDEVPWCATAEHEEVDWRGCVWGGYGDRV